MGKGDHQEEGWGQRETLGRDPGERPWGIMWNSAPKCLPCSTVASEM